MDIKVGDKFYPYGYSAPNEVLIVTKVTSTEVVLNGKSGNWYVNPVVLLDPTWYTRVEHTHKNETLTEEEVDEIVNTIILKPDEEWHPSDLVLPPGYNPETQKQDRSSCTCGMAAIGGGLHSDWCNIND